MNQIPKNKFNSHFIFRPFKSSDLKNSASLNPLLIKKLQAFCHSLTSTEFTQVWKNYDINRNGFIDGQEITNFLSDLLAIAMKEKKINELEFKNLQDEFLKQYDLNKDGKMEIGEVAKLLIPEENFLAIIRYEEPMVDGYDFIKAWIKHAGNKNVISSDEVMCFLGDLFRISNRPITEEKLEEYTASLISLYDRNQDGILSFKEMSRIISPEDNYFLKFKDEYVLSYKTFNTIFDHYDKDKNGIIAGSELIAFIRDILYTINIDATESAIEIEKFRKLMLKLCDKNKDGMFQREEMALWLGVNLPEI